MRLLFTALAFLISVSMFGQEVKIKVHVEGLKHATVYLANYYGSNLFYSDTTIADANGNFSFPGKPYDECGKYAIVLPGPVYFDFMLVNEPMEFRTTMANPQGDMVVIKSEENIVFYDYLSYLNTKREERAPHDAILNDSKSSPLQIEIAKNAMVLMNSEVMEYQDDLINDPRNYLFGKYLGLLKEPTIPEAPAHINISQRERWKYLWYKNHYWDRVDFDDPRLVRDGSFHNIISRWWGQVIEQDPDTLFTEGVKLLEKVKGNPDMFKYILHHMTHESELSEVTCMWKVFVNLVIKYYDTGKVDWLDDDKLLEIIDRAYELKSILKNSDCGDVIINISDSRLSVNNTTNNKNNTTNNSNNNSNRNTDGNDNIRIRISNNLVDISKVAVIGKESNFCDGSTDDGQGIAELVEGELLGIYGVVERKHLEEILDEQKLAMSGLLFEDSDFAQAGCLAGAQGTVLVSYGCLQGKTKLQIKLVDCSTSDLYWSATGFDVSEFDLLDALRIELSN